MEINEIIAQFESKRKNSSTDLTCLESINNMTKLFDVPSDSSIVLLDRTAHSVKAVFDKYAAVIEILKTGITFNMEDVFHFATYYVDGEYAIIKNIFKVDGLKTNHRGTHTFNRSCIRSIKWNLRTNYVGEERKQSRAIPMRVNQPWDHRQGSIHSFMNANELRQEPIIQTMIDAKFYAVIDYLNELEQAEAVRKSISRYDNVQMHVNLSWSELLKAKSMKEIKSTKWKRICALNVNAGKMNVFQLNAIKNLRPYITWEQTDRIIQALRQGSNYSTDPAVFSKTVFPKLATEDDVNARTGYYIWDILKMAKDLKRRIDIHPVTDATVRNLHDNISREHRDYQTRQKYSGEKNNLKIAEVFQPIVNAVPDDERYEVITQATELIKEGSEMNHCVGSYVDDVNNGRCVIVRGNLNNERVTIEFQYDRLEEVLVAKQVQMKHNQQPSQETMNDVYNLLDSINEKEVDYSKYDWGYHGVPRRELHELEHDELDQLIPF